MQVKSPQVQVPRSQLPEHSPQVQLDRPTIRIELSPSPVKQRHASTSGEEDAYIAEPTKTKKAPRIPGSNLRFLRLLTLEQEGDIQDEDNEMYESSDTIQNFLPKDTSQTENMHCSVCPPAAQSPNPLLDPSETTSSASSLRPLHVEEEPLDEAQLQERLRLFGGGNHARMVRRAVVYTPEFQKHQYFTPNYRFANSGFVLALVSDAYAGGPLEAFLALQKDSEALLGNYRFWKEAYAYLATKRRGKVTGASAVRTRQGRSLAMDFLGREGCQKLSVPRDMRQMLSELLPIGQGDDLLRSAQGLAAEVHGTNVRYLITLFSI